MACKAPEQNKKKSPEKQRRTKVTLKDLRYVYENAPIAIAILDRSGSIIQTNAKWRADDWETLWGTCINKDDGAADILQNSFAQALNGEIEQQRTTILTATDGVKKAARWVLHPWKDASDAVVGAMLFVENVTRETEASRLAEERNIILDAVLENVGQAILACDAQGKLTYVNGRVSELVAAQGVKAATSREAIRQITFFEQDGKTPYKESRLPLSKALTGVPVSREEMVLKNAENEKTVFEATAKSICDERGRVTGAVVSLYDVSDQRERERKLRRSEAEARRIAFTDALTGFPNRVSLQRTLEHDLAELCKPGEKLLVISADIARFKTINAIHGNKVGDRLLAETADRMAGIAGARAIVGRLSGDEFLLLVPVDPADPYSVTEKLCTIMNGQQVISGHLLTVQLHAGTALWPDDGEDGNTLLRRADVARQHVKTQNGQSLRHFDPKLEADASRQLKIEQDLAKAMKQNEFSVVYQPIVDAMSSEVEGFEALCRWNHPKLGFIPPDVFIQAAEQTGDILDLGEWMLRRVMEDLLDRPDLSVAVNVSPSQFVDPQFSQRLESALVEFDFDPRRLELEVTESLVLEDQAHIQKQIKTLQAIGVRLALDDFGTGYSSLAYLQNLKFDKLKIDRSFVMRLGEDREALALVQCMIQMGKSLNMQVVAEGIETEAHALMLRHAGCDSFQGYYFAKPLPLDEALTFGTDGDNVHAFDDGKKQAAATP
ncbi:MAG: EAL domain-containing protein [Pseudomonadota bacterium]